MAKELGSYKGTKLYEGENLATRIKEIDAGGGATPPSSPTPTVTAGGAFTQRHQAVEAAEQKYGPQYSSQGTAFSIINNPDGTFSVSGGASGGGALPSPTPGEAPIEGAKPSPSPYQVAKGDTLSGIAARRGLTLSALIAANPQIKNPNLIRPGESITVPEEEGTPNQFRTGFKAKISSGEPPPTTTAGGRAAVSGALPPAPAPEAPDILTSIFGTDPTFKGLFDAFQKYMSPGEQRKLLVDEYKGLSKELGIEKMNSDLLNMKNVIEGTEDDIRTEVTKAGGFATESQVLALTNARNKQLIKNYNTLLETRNNAKEQLSTMIGLVAKDREEADRRVDKVFDFAFKIADYKVKMKDNATNQYNKIVDKVGYKGLYQQLGGDPYSVGLVEKTLGLQPGGLETLAGMKVKGEYGPGIIGEYQYYVEQEKAAGRRPLGFNAYQTLDANRKRSVVNVYGAPYELPGVGMVQKDSKGNIKVLKTESSESTKRIKVKLPSGAEVEL